MKIPKRFEINQRDSTITIVLTEEETGYSIKICKTSDNRGDGSIIFKNQILERDESDLLKKAIEAIDEHLEPNFSIEASFEDANKEDYHIKDFARGTRYYPQTGEVTYRINSSKEDPFGDDSKDFFDKQLSHLIMIAHEVLKNITKTLKDFELAFELYSQDEIYDDADSEEWISSEQTNND